MLNATETEKWLIRWFNENSASAGENSEYKQTKPVVLAFIIRDLANAIDELKNKQEGENHHGDQ